MLLKTLELLRCPFCGGRLSLDEEGAVVRAGDHIESGVIGCQCCAFPIVGGIPVMVADDATRAAMHALEAGEGDQALYAMLGLDDERVAAFEAFLAAGDGTYREAIAVLSPDAEGQYFVYRFSDQTFLLAQAVLRALGSHAALGRRTLDLCGGSGHLTRVLAGFTPPGDAVLADVFFWKLWLARRFTAPGCEPVCCDANNPLPFARGVFSLAVCSDAFPYIWHKRLFAEEMMRAVGADGTVVMSHLHSALGENVSAGMTLTPEGYRDLFAPLAPRLFRDSELLDQVLDRGALDLTTATDPQDMGSEPSITLIASQRDALFKAYELVGLPAPPPGVLVVNPLYRIEFHHGTSRLTLRFPTPEYAEEFGECRRYLPDTVDVHADLRGPLDAAAIGADYATLRSRSIIIDAPPGYC